MTPEPETFLLSAEKGDRFDFNKEELTVGRKAGNDLHFPFPEVSGKHATIKLTESGWQIEDLGSTNGTFVNGEKLTGASTIANGDAIKFGRKSYIFHCPPSAADGDDEEMTMVFGEEPDEEETFKGVEPSPAAPAAQEEKSDAKISDADFQHAFGKSELRPEAITPPPTAKGRDEKPAIKPEGEQAQSKSAISNLIEKVLSQKNRKPLIAAAASLIVIIILVVVFKKDPANGKSGNKPGAGSSASLKDLDNIWKMVDLEGYEAALAEVAKHRQQAQATAGSAEAYTAPPTLDDIVKTVEVLQLYQEHWDNAEYYLAFQALEQLPPGEARDLDLIQGFYDSTEKYLERLAGEPYQSGIAMFEQESYLQAQTNFLKTQEIHPEYQQVSLYLERVEVALYYSDAFQEIEGMLDDMQTAQALTQIEELPPYPATEVRPQVAMDILNYENARQALKQKAQAYLMYEEGRDLQAKGGVDNYEALKKYYQALTADPDNSQVERACLELARELADEVAKMAEGKKAEKILLYTMIIDNTPTTAQVHEDARAQRDLLR